MTIRFKDLVGRTIAAKDGEVGEVVDILFDDKRWGVRYFVVDTSAWLPMSKVLLSPASISLDPLRNQGVLNSHLSKEQIKNSPPLDDDLPVSRQHEERLNDFFGWSPWWGIPDLIQGPYTNVAAVDPEAWNKYMARRGERFSENLRSCNEVAGYKIKTTDKEEFGAIKDFLIDPDEWLISDVTMGSHRWMPGGREFICSPMYVSDIDCEGQFLEVAIHKDTLLESPDFDEKNYDEVYRKSLVELHCRTINLPKPVVERQRVV